MASQSIKTKTIFRTEPPRKVRWSSYGAALPLVVGVSEDGAICRVTFAKRGQAENVVKQWRRSWPKTEFVKDASAAQALSGRKTPSLRLTGTPFQQAVWKQLLAVPSGEVVSYGELARRVKKPRAARAVGTACGANPILMFVPCHRVIAGDGTLGGFACGLDVKRKLLKAEKTKL